LWCKAIRHLRIIRMFSTTFSRESSFGGRETALGSQATNGQESTLLREGSNGPSPASTPRSIQSDRSNFVQRTWKSVAVVLGMMLGVASILQVAVFTGYSPRLFLTRKHDRVDVANGGGRVSKLRRCLSECLEANSRWTAARALGQLTAKVAIPDLRKAFHVDVNEDVRMNAAQALGQMHAREAIIDFRAGLQNETEAVWVRAYCADALGRVKAIEAMDDLRTALRHNSHRYVRSHSAWALGEMHASPATGDLRRALREDAEEVVRSDCAKALGKLGATDAAHDLIAALLHDDSTAVAVYAATALKMAGTPAVIPELRTALLNSSRPEVRSGAADALGHLHAKDAADDLITALSYDMKPDVRESAAFALGRLRCQQALGKLVTIMYSSNSTGLVAAAFAVTYIEGPEQGVKLLCSGNSTEKVRLGAAEALGEMHATEALKCLKSALTDTSRYVQVEARKSIQMIEDQPGSVGGA